MKSIFTLLLILALIACSTKNSDDKASYEEWKEMQSFHLIMADAFHPYKDSANLAPAKTLAKEMSEEAAKWLSAPLPEKVNDEEMKSKLQNLNAGSQGFLKLVTDNSADSVVAQSLTDLHHLFHEIQEGWYGAGKEKEGDHKEHH
jgi:hypothetical protein